MSRSPSSEGFTLVEVLAALGTVAVLLTGVMALLLAASGAIRASRVSSAATVLALQKVEELRAAPSVSAGVSQDYFAVDGIPAASTSAAYVRRWTTVPAWGGGTAVSVRVEIFAGGEGRIADVETVISRDGSERS